MKKKIAGFVLGATLLMAVSLGAYFTQGKAPAQENEQNVATLQDNPELEKYRTEAVERALSYVGKVHYNQSQHGSPLEEGSGNDCSGFVSQIHRDLLGANYTTATFYTTFKPEKWDETQVQPGDIILHYGGEIADGENDNALIYTGIDPETGKHTSVDLSAAQGATYRSRGDRYYQESYVIKIADLF